jgi:hypothetical protein
MCRPCFLRPLPSAFDIAAVNETLASVGVLQTAQPAEVLKLYKLLFRHAPADLREDERVEKCIRAASASNIAHGSRWVFADLCVLAICLTSQSCGSWRHEQLQASDVPRPRVRH